MLLESNMDMITIDELIVLEFDEEMQSFHCRKRDHLFHTADPVGVVIVSLLLTLNIFHTFTPAREALENHENNPMEMINISPAKIAIKNSPKM